MFVGLCVWLHVSVVHLLKDNAIEYGRGKVPKSGSQSESGKHLEREPSAPDEI